MPLPKNLNPLPDHPAILTKIPYSGRINGKALSVVQIQCPRCLEIRERTASETRLEMKRERFKGLCRPCSFAANREGTHRRGDSGRTHNENSNGYRLALLADISDEDLPLYRAMQTSSYQPPLEHRWVMAKYLNRPLRSDELVDHMDGDKQNNDLSNLRIYIKGHNNPGSTYGYGTFYHEWQLAEAKIVELERKLSLIKTFSSFER